ncbi:MAG: helix-turn-helix transcriptional regulator [Clostridia bacterium]|nr:helix-turn-helix transcriptional regulator [Clostridia bacterium]
MSFGLTSQMLDACVLAVVAREDVYGYVLTQNIRAIVDISESTLYPVLRRLQKDGLLETYDQPFNGRNRRFYSSIWTSPFLRTEQCLFENGTLQGGLQYDIIGL